MYFFFGLGMPEPEEATLLPPSAQVPSYLTQTPRYGPLVHPPYIPQPLLLGLMHPQVHPGWQPSEAVPVLRFSPTVRTV